MLLVNAHSLSRCGETSEDCSPRDPLRSTPLLAQLLLGSFPRLRLFRFQPAAMLAYLGCLAFPLRSVSPDSAPLTAMLKRRDAF